ncbi:uncharacterized protein LOC118287394 isoform X2 [Scophthalmus maximus]|uniref:uncharacterized protein LOC118287394 isoform X2 n=1 Tax=Scophthalmus maximus TaxID=52904 RepID=UPI0015E0882F|nr:uncharacterized protein LOC118287394 isoform X2 [Scophthalmus maximus]
MANFQLYQFNPESDTNREEEQAGSPDAFQPRLEQDGSEWFSEERIRTPFLSAAGLEPNCLNLYTLQNGLRTSEVQNRRTLMLWDATTGSSSRHPPDLPGVS